GVTLAASASAAHADEIEKPPAQLSVESRDRELVLLYVHDGSGPVRDLGAAPDPQAFAERCGCEIVNLRFIGELDGTPFDLSAVVSARSAIANAILTGASPGAAGVSVSGFTGFGGSPIPEDI